MSRKPTIDFDGFRHRLTIIPTKRDFDDTRVRHYDKCLWVSGSGTYCYDWKTRDLRKVYKYFKRHPDADDLHDFPEYLYRYRFL